MNMEGMHIHEYFELLKYIQAHHQFGNGLSIKYVTNTYDTRFQQIMSVSFKRGGHEGICFSTNHFAGQERPDGWIYDSLYDLCMAYLKGTFVPSHEFNIDKG